MLHVRLLELRKGKGLTQADIAKMLKITPQAYSLYETNKNNISNETLCVLADFFEVTVDYLLGRQDEKPSFLSEEEREIIQQYRALDDRAKENVKHTLAYEYERAERTAPKKKTVYRGICEFTINRIYQLCRERKITPNALSYMAGVPQVTVKSILNGENKNPGIVTLKKICDGLEITIMDFFDTPEYQKLKQELK